MCLLDLRGDASLQHNGYDVQDLPSSGEQLMLEVIHDALPSTPVQNQTLPIGCQCRV